MKAFSIGEVSTLLNISISTLRYYDKEGILNAVERTEGGIRIFREKDLQQLHMVECLKRTGMQLKDIKQFFDWVEEGDSSIGKRYEMFLERKRELEYQMELLQNSLDLVSYKCEYYRAASELGTLDSPQIEAISQKAAQRSAYIKDIIGR